MSTRTIPLLLVAVSLATACAENGGDADVGTGPVIVTTTTSPTSTGTSESAGTSEPPDATVATSTGAEGTDPAPSSADTSTTTDAPTTTTTTTVPPQVGDPSVRAEQVASFRTPVDLVPRPGTADDYVVEQGGRIVRWSDGGTDVALDLAGRVSGGGEQGLLGLAFSPDGDLAYVNFTDGNGTTTVAEYAVAGDGSLDPASERVLLTVDQPYSNHNAGDLETGPDGLLYIPLGDGGSGGDPERRASDPTSLLGSLLRIDPTPSADAPYTIPDDNPFAAGPLDGIDGAPEVFAWGLRNPWKIAFDPETAELWIADVGQNRFEEVDVVGPTGGRVAGWGHDFGWSALEGTERFNDDVPVTDRMTSPVLTYSHDTGGCSVSGGVPYRGSAIPELEPAYVYSDYCLGTIWALDLDGGRNLVLAEGLGNVTAVRTGADGEIYVLTAGGAVHRLVAG